jgi:uncharacterized protein YbgA (DUF1722 family)/uncharacterized protein YbbK (DUF523 family)
MSTHPSPALETLRIRLGVSACLLGQEVRFDGGHKRDEFLLNTLGRYVEWVPVCPEVEVGLGVPRETLRLVDHPENPRLVAPKSGQDHTKAMQTWAHKRLKQLANLNLHGYILKKNSPSCGLFRVKVYNDNPMPAQSGQGIFAQELVKRLPLLPVEEEGRLRDARLRENFIERIFAYHRWTHLCQARATPQGLVAFHTTHKLTLMAHSPRAQNELGRLVAQAGRRRLSAVLGEYGRGFMEALSVLATNRKHANVLFHLMGFLKDHLGREDKAEVVQVIEDYRQGLVPLIVPITLLRHHLRRHPVPDWVHQQVYLNPYPKELWLRNHV